MNLNLKKTLYNYNYEFTFHVNKRRFIYFKSAIVNYNHRMATAVKLSLRNEPGAADVAITELRSSCLLVTAVTECNLTPTAYVNLMLGNGRNITLVMRAQYIIDKQRHVSCFLGFRSQIAKNVTFIDSSCLSVYLSVRPMSQPLFS